MSDYTISGHKISQIPDNEYPTRNSLFYTVLSSQLLSSEELSSESIKYANLSSRIVADIIDALGLGSMAHEEKYLYSLSSHNHDKLYSRVRIRDLYTDAEDKVLSVASITIRNDDETSTYSIVTPRIQTYKYADAKVGTLKFVAVNRNIWNLKQYGDGKYNIDVDAEDFDGWVFPNGGKLDSLDMTLPDLSKFVKLQPTSSRRIQFKNALIKHGHDDVNTNLQMKGVLDMYRCWIPSTSQPFRDGNYAHNGGTEHTTPASLVLDFARAHIRGRYTENPNSEYMIETKPYHNLMPVMIYIGTREAED